MGKENKPLEQVLKILEKHSIENQITKEESIRKLIFLGFCQPVFYKASVWAKAKKIMDYAVSLNIGVYHKPVRGKGHYWNFDDVDIYTIIESFKLEINKYIGAEESKKC